MRKVLLITLIVLTPALFVTNVWQAYRFSRIEGKLRAIQQEHVLVLEENKRLIVGIAGLRSPARIRDLAEGDLELELAPADRIERIRYGNERLESE